MSRRGKRKAEDYCAATWMPQTSYPGSSTITGTPSNHENPFVKSPPAKRRRKAKDSDESQPEKRGAIFKKSCPKNILERVNRVMSQRFFMIDRRREGTELHEEFSVLGSTGNVYTVVIDKKPSCSCPDALKGNHCKHILFIYLKVLQVPQNSGCWYQKALLTSELSEIFALAPPAPNSVTHPQVQAAYNKAIGKEGDVTVSSGSSQKRIPGPDDDCPICYDTMHQVDDKKLTFCEACGNALHTECFQKWAKATPNLTCVWCRAKWTMAGPTASGSSRFSEGYINLSNVAGVSPVRDTSSYYRGPRRGGRSYGYPGPCF